MTVCTTHTTTRTHHTHTPHTSVSNGDIVEVHWEAEDAWFEGEVLSVDRSDGTFLVHYFEDQEEVWHDFSSMSFRVV